MGQDIDRKSTMLDPYAPPAVPGVDARGDEARALLVAGILVAAVALVRTLCCIVMLYVGATGSDVLADLPRGIRATVIYEVMALPVFAPLVLVYGTLAVPLIRGSKRFRWATLAVQAVYTVVPLFFLKVALVRGVGSSTTLLAVANFLLGLLSFGILRLLLYGRPTPRRFRLASVGIAMLVLVWTTRLVGFL